MAVQHAVLLLCCVEAVAARGGSGFFRGPAHLDGADVPAGGPEAAAPTRLEGFAVEELGPEWEIPEVHHQKAPGNETHAGGAVPAEHGHSLAALGEAAVVRHQPRTRPRLRANDPELSLWGSSASTVETFSQDHRLPRAEDMLRDYDTDVPPAADDGTVKVDLAFYAIKMISLDHVGQTVTIAGWIRQYWYDPRLRWESRDGKPGGPSSEFVPVGADKIWKPDTTLVNSVEFNYAENCQDVDVRIFPDGGDFNVYWARPCLLKAKCIVDLELYPFDTNNCGLHFEPWGDFFVKLRTAPEGMGSMITLPEFKVTRFKERFETETYYPTLPGIPISRVSVKFKIDRHGHYYVVNYICPIMLMILMSWLSLAIPIKSSDRVQFMVTMVLTVMTVNFVTAEKRPASNKDSWLDDFQTLSLLLVVTVTAYTVALYRFAPQPDWNEERTGKRMPLVKFLDRVARVVVGVAVIIIAVYLINKFLPSRSGQSSQVKDFEGQATIWTLVLLSLMMAGMLFFMFLSWFPQSWYYDNVRKLEEWRWFREHPAELPSPHDQDPCSSRAHGVPHSQTISF